MYVCNVYTVHMYMCVHVQKLHTALHRESGKTRKTHGLNSTMYEYILVSAHIDIEYTSYLGGGSATYI